MGSAAHSTTETRPADRLFGIVLVSTAAAVFGLTGALTKSIHADPLTITCWRGLVGAIVIAVYVLWRRQRSSPRSSLRLGWRGWLLTLFALGVTASGIRDALAALRARSESGAVGESPSSTSLWASAREVALEDRVAELEPQVYNLSAALAGQVEAESCFK